MKTSREQFEEWYLTRFDAPSWGFNYDEKASCFGNPCVEDKWLAWKASRSAIEVELPEITDKKYESKHIEGGFRSESFWVDCRKAIHDAGAKVKGA